MQIIKTIKSMLVPGFISEYGQEYQNFSGKKGLSPIKNYRAGISSKGPPECQPEAYDCECDFLPDSRGDSNYMASYQIQPPITKSINYKPPSYRSSPIIQGTRSMEIKSCSRSCYVPFPIELTRKIQAVIPASFQKDRMPVEYSEKSPSTTCYRRDYCRFKTQPRRICFNSGENAGTLCCTSAAVGILARGTQPENIVENNALEVEQKESVCNC